MGEAQALAFVLGKNCYNKIVKKIYFLRHGETVDDERQCVSSPSSALSKLGKEQIKQAARKLSSENISEIFHSKYLRAKQSAQIVADYLGVKSKELDFIHEKVIPKKFYGTSRSDEDQLKEYKKYKEAWLKARVESPESFEEFLKRLDKTLEYLLALEDGKTYLFVSHDLFIRSLFFRVVLKDSFDTEVFKKLYNTTRSDFASLSLFTLEDSKIFTRTLSDSSHLRKVKSSKKLVTIGGGTGQYTLLKALKELDFDL